MTRKKAAAPRKKLALNRETLKDLDSGSVRGGATAQISDLSNTVSVSTTSSKGALDRVVTPAIQFNPPLKQR